MGTACKHKEPSLLSCPTLLIFVLLLASFSANALNDAIQNSGTCDELGAHISSGYLYLNSGTFSGGINNFPLGQVIIALPVKLLGYSYQLFTEEHLLLFRSPILLMGLVMGVLVYLFTSNLFGQNAGLAALLLFAFSPNLLAHASLATLDFPTAFFIFLTVYLLCRYIEKPGTLRILAFGLAFSAALLTKVQALVLIAVAGLALVVFIKQMLPANRRQKLAFFASWLIVPLTVFVLINLTYLHLPTQTHLWLPAQFTSAIKGKLLHSSSGHFTYLMGEYSAQGWWYFFPLAIVLKTPLWTLVLFAVGLFRKHSRKTIIFVLIPIALLLATAMKSRVNIGLRHILTIYPFLFVLGGYGATKLWKFSWGKIVFAICTAAYVGQSLFFAPHHLSYFNLLVGGPKNGHKYLIDSNIDWGQNDHFLRRYIASKNIEYKINPNAFVPTTGHILVNTNALFGVINAGPKAYAWLKTTNLNFKPVNRIAYTWFEYDIPADAFPRQQLGPNAVQQQILAYLFDLREPFSKFGDPKSRLLLANLFAELRAYDLALDEIGSILSRHPAHAPALLLGGELTVRHKLGVLAFEQDEYLKGFKTPKPPANVLASQAQIIKLTRLHGGYQKFSQLHTALGLALLEKGNRDAAIPAFRLALRFDPENPIAVKHLRSPAR